jgi:glutathione S-transferase
MKMKPYYAPTTGATAVRIVLDESGIPYEAIKVNFCGFSDPVTIEFRKLNPIAHLLVLVLGDGTVVTQMVATLQLIADEAPQKNLMPAAGSAAYTQAMRWLSFLAADVHTAFATDFTWTSTWDTDEERQNPRRLWKERPERRLVIIETQLDANEYINGAYSVADPYLLVIMGWADRQPFLLSRIQIFSTI